MVVLLTMGILVGLGEKMAEGFLPIYVLALGGSALAVGFLSGMDNLLSALYSYPGGYASDRLGYKRALIVFNLIAMLGYLIVILFPYWQAVIVGSVFFLSWTAISLPATMDMVSSVLPMNKRTMGVSMHSLVRRVPMALGPVLGGILIGLFGEKDGVRLAFVAALVLGGVSLVMQQVFIQDDKRRERKAEGNPLRALSLMSPSLRNLLTSDILIRFCEQIPYAFVVVWAVGTAAAPGPVTALEFGLLRTIEMATAILVYLPVAYFADRTAKKPFVLLTFAFFTLFPVVLLASRSFLVLALAFILRGLKEFGEPTRKALIMDLAPEGEKAGMFGLYYLARDVIVSGAALAGAFLWEVRPEANFLVATGFGAVGTLWFALRGRDLGRGEQDPAVSLPVGGGR